MLSVSAKPLHGYPWFARLLFWKQRRIFGRVLDPSLLWARSPWVFAAFALLYGALERRSSPLSPALRSLVMVRVSQINHCAFCVDINSALLAKREVSLAKREVSEQKISGIAEWRQTDLFAPDECLALEYAEAASLNKVDDNLRRRLKERWGDDTIVELTGLIAFQNLSAKFNSALDVPAQGFCRSPR
jgi:AhpD family alkylhydroperoxidase